MKIISLFFPFFILFGSVNQNNDVQVWINESISKEFSPKLSFYVMSEQRIGDDASTLFYYYLQSNVTYSPTTWLSISPGYRQAFSLNEANSRWVAVYDPLIDLFFHKKIRGWKISDRNRFQYFFSDTFPNAWQYRNQITIISPWKWGAIQCNPAFFEEIFFLEHVGFSENRTAIGAHFTPFEVNTFSTFYMLRFLKKQSHWTHQNILYFLLNFSF